jgi:23S rRNA (uridine2552-2'-O)-methyltransferase
VFKLEEVDRKHGLLRPRQTVLDLGCSPGSWLLYASQKVGVKGLVVGVDLHELRVALPANCRFLMRDVEQLTPADLAHCAPAAFDVVLSDMAPSTSGSHLVDHQRSLRLVLRALEIAEHVCRTGGSFLGKVFQGEDLAVAETRGAELFEQVRIARPRAVRKASTEVYLVARGRRAAPKALAAGPAANRPPPTGE